ncbi:hypothetical protein M2474_002403 [Dysgonomonas sp. PH5-37]|nr:hypothetical protein [Dysgonomonas sp. PH5-37]
MIIVNSQILPYICQCSISSIEQGIGRSIILWSEPFSFHDPPKRLSNIQMRRIWWYIKKKKSSFFPERSHQSDFCIPMHAGIVKHYKCLFGYFERILIQETDNLLGINRFTGAESLKMIITADHPKDIESFSSLGGYIQVLSRKLPSVWHITFGTNMRFITVKEVDLSLGIQCFKFLQLSGLILIKPRRGDSPWTSSYTSISCAKADKKRLNVNSLASLPEEFCQASLAKRTLCLSDSMALRTASSSEQSMIGLRPCPGRVCKPLIPSDSNRFTQPLTLGAVIPVCSPTCTELKPSDLSNTARQRMRKQWLSPKRKPCLRESRSNSVNVNILIFISIYIWYATKIRRI